MRFTHLVLSLLLLCMLGAPLIALFRARLQIAGGVSSPALPELDGACTRIRRTSQDSSPQIRMGIAFVVPHRPVEGS